MLVSRLKINIENLYISKPLERETFINVMDSHHGTIHSLYLIANELKSMHYFLELTDHPTYTVTAYVSVYHGYCGEAKNQISTIKSMRDKAKQRPYMSIVYKQIEKSTMKEVFSFKHLSTSKKEIYNLIDRFHKKTEELCKVNMF